MTVLQDGILTFFSAVGMTTVVWLAAGALLHAGRPTVPGLMLVLPLKGEALAMENDVRERRMPGNWRHIWQTGKKTRNWWTRKNFE